MRSFARGTKAVLPEYLTARVGKAHFCSYMGNSSIAACARRKKVSSILFIRRNFLYNKISIFMCAHNYSAWLIY